MFQQNLKCYLGFAVCAGEEKKEREREREKIGVTGRNTENMFSVKEKKKPRRGRWVCCYLQDLKSKVLCSQ